PIASHGTETALQPLQDHRLVIYKQYAFRHWLFTRARNQRQPDVKGGAFAGFGLEPQLSPALADDHAVRQRQSLPGTFAQRLGSEKRLENAAANLLRDARAGV